MESNDFRTVVEAFLSQAKARPDATCLAWWPEDSSEIKEYSFQWVAERASSFRKFLAKINSDQERRQTVVAVAVPDGPELLLAQLGILLAGACYLPVDINDPRCKETVAEAEATVLVVRECHLPLVKSWAIETIFHAEELFFLAHDDELEPTGVVDPDSLSHIFFTSGSTGTPKGVCVKHKSLYAFVCAKILVSKVTENSRIFLPSSITFDPNLGDSLVSVCSGACLCATTRERITGGSLLAALQKLDVTHACMTPTMWAMRGGEETDTNSNDDESIPLRVPCLEELSLGGEPMPAALALAARGWTKRGYKLRLVNTYGVTEATVYQASFHVNSRHVEGEQHPRVLGWPYPGTVFGLLHDSDRISIAQANELTRWVTSKACEKETKERDAKRPKCECQCQGETESGEIIIAGAQVAVGYLNRATLSKERFCQASPSSSPSPSCSSVVDRQQLFRTGDVGRFVWLPWASTEQDDSVYGACPCSCGRASGPWIEWLGRKDSQIKHRGVRIEVEEIEAKVAACRSIVQKVVVCKHVESDQLISYVEPVESLQPRDRPDQPFFALNRCVEVALRAFCERHLPPIMVPSRFVGITSFASFTSANGKLNRRLLSEEGALPPQLPLVPGSFAVGEEVTSDIGSGTDLTPLESLVGEIWLHRLNLTGTVITPWDSFVQLGGDSLDAQRCCQDLAQKAFDNDQENTTAVSLFESSRTRGELVGGLQPKFLLQSQSLRAYAAHLESTNIASLLQLPPASENGAVSEKPTLSSSGGGEDVVKRALFIAAGDGLLPVLQVLVDPLLVGFSPDANVDRNQRAKTPLHVACANGQLQAVQLLLDNGANIFATTKEKIQAAHIAAAYPDDVSADMLKLLIVAMRKRNVRSPASVRDGRRQTLLHAAARGGNVLATQVVLQEFAKDFAQDEEGRVKMVSCMDRWHRTALHWAVLNNHEACARALLQAGANPAPHFGKKKSSTHLPYETPLQIASRKGFTSLVTLLQITDDSRE